MNVIKRNGEIELFDEGRITNAVTKAVKKSMPFWDNMRMEVFANKVTVGVLDEILANFSDEEDIELEYIQHLVVGELIKHGHQDVIEEYIQHRYDHELDRMIEDKRIFIEEYSKAKNAATGSKFDANANVEVKNIATLGGEVNKKENILLNRKMMYYKLCELYGRDTADEYIRQLESHEIYTHDESSIKPYCVSINMYPFLKSGMKSLNGESGAPKHLQSFNGLFINMVFAVASQFAGAVATPEYLMYLDYFIRKEYGDDYSHRLNDVVDLSLKQRTIKDVIEDGFQQVVHSINTPSAARDYQSVFWNISYFDKYYFESMFGNFIFPDFTKPQWDSLDALQRMFMKWFNKERLVSSLTFPVETMALLTDGEDIKDKEYADFTAEMYSEGHSFFLYTSESADSLASCCRLRNEVTDNDFSFSLGAGGVATGSKNVITINMNRLIQDATRNDLDLDSVIRLQVRKIHKYQTAYNEIIKEYFNRKMLPVFSAGYISMEKQFLTIGLNGAVEGAEFLGIDISPNEEYFNFLETILKPIYEENKKAKTSDVMFNSEFVPAENLGVKHAKWDREDGYFVPRDVYNSYFYIVEDDKVNIYDKLKLHGKRSVNWLDGGSACHLNLDEHLTKDQYRQLLKIVAQEGTNYITFNIPNTVCNECGHISKHKLGKCPECGSENLDYLTRVIGYLKRVSSFSSPRQKEEGRRFYGTNIR